MAMILDGPTVITIRSKKKIYLLRNTAEMERWLQEIARSNCLLWVFRDIGRRMIYYFTKEISFRIIISTGLSLLFTGLLTGRPIRRLAISFVLFLLQMENPPVNGKFLRMALQGSIP